MWSNALMSGNVISLKYSPMERVIVNHLNSKKNCKVTLGSYVEDHDGTNKTENMSPSNHK